MQWSVWMAALRARWGTRRLEKDLRDDMAFHLEMSEAAFRAAGHAPDEARRLARLKFGGVDRFEAVGRVGVCHRRDCAADR